MSTPTPHWLSAFLDLAPDEHATAVAFWQGVTCYDLSPARGEHGEFATLVPDEGDDFLRVQRLGEGPSRVHLDVHVDDPDAWAARAEQLGARVLARPGHVVLASPGGLVFCLVTHPAADRPAPVAHDGPGGSHESLVDQVAIDIPGAHYAHECAFWAALTGWPLQDTASPEFMRILTPPAQPLRILLQQLDEPDGVVRAHLDLATTDRRAEVARHVSLGARVAAEGRGWTVMAPPAGPVYCITDRDPATGSLAP